MALVVASCVVMSGCGSTQELAPVRGKVTYKGKPLTTGVVMFQPLSGPPARGRIQPDGTFELEMLGEGAGAPLGTNRVRVSSREPSADTATETALGKLLIPKRYTDFATSGLTVEVAADRTEPYLIELED
ncbi:hypothetical protein [Botrimarina mediterranea]|uniref:Carboxypeptidase regulatory-like domain-containing protein n=1 Tax=Botrimarina mediterranea TaxID=2528022 RepID=A0A518K2E4_9BACT|nr:hypothetical protein [Botrimarina mediterranea]QDV71939.1 hypothetical protein Spa11_01080 [Botrimarina mediterranea]QDV76480.1 hypothetical protein K2D_00580 [Planctomycetes bacterium K2D]